MACPNENWDNPLSRHPCRCFSSGGENGERMGIKLLRKKNAHPKARVFVWDSACSTLIPVPFPGWTGCWLACQTAYSYSYDLILGHILDTFQSILS